MATVLVVEDNPANMKLTTMFLRRAGHTVLAAFDAETGLSLARGQHPDLIVMDIELPGMDGLAATAVLKNDPQTASIPVVALSAQEWSQSPGCDAFIVKPLRYKELYAVIERLMPQGPPTTAAQTRGAI